MHVWMPVSHVLYLLLSVCVCISLAQDEESVPVELRTLPEYKELLELKRLKKQKLQEIQEDKVGVRHVGYKVKTVHGATQHVDDIKARLLQIQVCEGRCEHLTKDKESSSMLHNILHFLH